MIIKLEHHEDIIKYFCLGQIPIKFNFIFENFYISSVVRSIENKIIEGYTVDDVGKNALDGRPIVLIKYVYNMSDLFHWWYWNDVIIEGKQLNMLCGNDFKKLREKFNFYKSQLI